VLEVFRNYQGVLKNAGFENPFTCGMERCSDANGKARLYGVGGVLPGRLRAFGNGPYAPAASNDSEEGRAKNRRVELVKQ
jgi:hypothetical protein